MAQGKDSIATSRPLVFARRAHSDQIDSADAYHLFRPSLVSTPTNVSILPVKILDHVSDMALIAFPPHTVVTMPALSPTMTAGNIGAWQKKPGDTIAPGDVLVEIETDKAQMDFEFQEDGVLATILKETGEKDVAVGNVSATLIDRVQG